MSSSPIVTPESTCSKANRYSLLRWLNNLLKTTFIDVRQIGSGACHCQIMDMVVRGSVDLTEVKFDARVDSDYKHNFSLLQEAFNKNNIAKTIPVDELITGNFKRNFEFMKWLKAFYMVNEKSDDYDAVAARSSCDISPLPMLFGLENDRVKSAQTEDGSLRKFVFDEQWKDLYDWVDRSALGDNYLYCRSCDRNLNVSYRGILDVKRHLETSMHVKRAAASRSSDLRRPAPCSELAVKFIHKHFNPDADDGEPASAQFVRRKLGERHPEDVVAVCLHTPYCVYVYGGMVLGKHGRISVVLVGFVDVAASRHCIRFLDVLPSPADDAGEKTASAVVETLKKFGLSQQNLVAVYLNGKEAATEQMSSQLRELNPNIVALGGLYDVADAACRAGVKALPSHAQELMADVHAHHVSCAAKNDSLTAVFGSDVPLSPLGAGCLQFSQLISRMLEKWSDVTSYFGSCNGGDDKVQTICSWLRDEKTRATFTLVEQALKPLLRFQRHVQQTEEESGPADLLLILEEASGLLGTYASCFLHPQAAARFLKERDTQILQNKTFHLSGPELSLGGRALGDALGECPAAALQEEALAFYIAVTGRVAEELPLSDWMLRSTAQLLNPRSRLGITGKTVEELATKLGLCSSAEDVRQLTSDFLEYQLVEEGQSDEGQKDASPVVSLEEHWGSVLKETKPSSIFRKLISTLLCLPRPPLDAQLLFTQALENGEQDSDGEVLTESESDCAFTDRSSVKDSPLDVNGLEIKVKPCRVQLTKIKGPPVTPDVPRENGLSWKKGPLRGGFDWEDTLRQTPQARAVFQAGASTWSKPVSFDKDGELNEEMSPSGKATSRGRRKTAYQDGRGFVVGQLVWGKVRGFNWWPGMVMPWKMKWAPPGIRRVEWFGDGMFSEIYTESLLPFRAFTKCFCRNSFASLPLYKEALFQIIELAAERSGKSFSAANGDKEKELKLMLEWAFEGFLPTGPGGFTPPDASPQSETSDSALSDCQPPVKRKYVFKNKTHVNTFSCSRELLKENVRDKSYRIEDLCLSCGSADTDVQHPLFEGSLCLKCKENFTETLYRYDEDGYQSYCTVCCAGSEVILCDNASCCRCFCKDCLEILVGPGTFDKMKDVDPWSCYMCRPAQCDGNLRLRPDWSVKVQDFFANNSAMEFEPHRVYPSIPAESRRPIRVLSLFDGIATGNLVLKDLGFKIERYIASEICEDSIAVGMVKHEGKIEYVNDVRTITRKHLAEWGPFDLLIGGSPCNDLSMVNPLRKGLFEGTGRLFFEFYRILTMLKPKEDDDRPFFWLFENVVFMAANDKADICRFLECNPILIDAVKVSPAHRARYFWGNLPGMNRPLAASLDSKVSLQDCLELGRTAKFDKVRTITTKSNSIRQGKMGPLPVAMNGKDDYLWCTEMEQVFGFPKHYTDVNNMGRAQRQKVLGRSWSVPVIRHLFSPLRDYFQCESQP